MRKKMSESKLHSRLNVHFRNYFNVEWKIILMYKNKLVCYIDVRKDFNKPCAWHKESRCSCLGAIFEGYPC